MLLCERKKANNFKFALSTLALPSSDDKGQGFTLSQLTRPWLIYIINVIDKIARKKTIKLMYLTSNFIK